MSGPTSTTRTNGEWLRLSAAAALLGLSACTLRRWSDQGRVPCHRTNGGQRRFRREDLDRLLRDAAPRQNPRRPLALARRESGPAGAGRRPNGAEEEAGGRDQILLELLELAGAITQRSDLHEFAQTVAGRVRDLLGVCECDVFICEGAGLRCLASADASGFDESMVGRSIALSDYPLSAAAMAARETLVVASPADPRLSDYERSRLTDCGLASELWIPLCSGTQLVGAIDIYDDKARDYGEIVGVTAKVGQLVAGALRAGLLLTQEEARATALREAVALGELAAQTADLDTLLVAVAERLLVATGAADCDIFRVTGEGEMSCLVSVDRNGRDETVSGEILSLADYPTCDHAVNTGEIVVIPDPADPRLTALDLEAYAEFGFQSEAVCPLISHGQVIGLFEIYDDHPRDFAMELDLLRYAGQTIGAAYERAALVQHLDRSNRDLKLVNATSMALSSSLDLDAVLLETASRLGDAVDAPCCEIFLRTSVDEITCSLSVTDGALDGAWIGRRFALEDLAVTREAIESRTPIAVATFADPRVTAAGRRYRAERGHASALIVPLAVASEVLGAAVLAETRRERDFSPEEAARAASICQVAALAVRNAQLHERMQEQTQRLSALLGSSRAIASTTDLEHILATVAQAAVETLRTEDCVIFAYDDDAETLTNVSMCQTSPGVYELQGQARPADEYPLGRALLVMDDVLEEHVSDPDLDPQSRAWMEQWGELSCLTVPLKYKGRPIGLLVLTESAHERHFSPEEVDVARALGEQAAAALHNHATLRFEAEQNARLESLLESSRAMTASGELGDALAVIARVTAEALRVPECMVFELDAAADAIVPRASYEVSPSGWDQLGVPFPLAEHPAERVMLRDGSVLEERLSDPDLDPASREAMATWGEQTCLSVPVKFGDTYRGLIVLYERERKRHFTEEEISLVRGLGEQAAAAIHSAQTLRRLEERNKVLADLLDAARATTSTLVLDEVLRVLARKAAEAMGSPSCLVWEYDAETDSLIERECYDVTGEYQAGGDAEALSEHPEQALALFSDGPLVETISDPEISQVSRTSMEKWGEKTCLSLPLAFGDERLGIIVFSETESERLYAPAELELAAGLADLAAIAIRNARIYQDLEHRNQELAASARRERLVSESSTALSSSLDLGQVLVAAAHRFTDLLDVGACDMYELDGDEFVCVASVVDGEAYPEWIGTRMKVDDYSADSLSIETRRPVAISSVDDPRLSEIERAGMREWGEKSILILPLVAKDRVVGSVQLLESRSEREFTADDLAAAEAICRMAGLAIDNARQYARLRSLNRETSERAARETLVNEISLELASTLDPQDILMTTALRMADSLDMTGCDIYRFEENEYVCVASVLDGDLCPEWIGRRVDVRDSASATLTAETRSTVVISSTDDPRLSETERQLMLKWGEKSLLILPMVAGGRLVGTIELTETRSEREFTPEAIATAEAIARMAALFLDNADLFVRQAEHARRLGSLLEAGRTITTSVVVDQVLAAIARTSAEALGSPSCVIYTYDPEAEALREGALFEAGMTTRADRDQIIPLDRVPGDRAILRGREIVVETLSDPALHPTTRASMERWGEQTCLNAPLYFGDEPLGILEVLEVAQERVFSEDDLEIIRGLSAQAAIALHNANLFDRLELRTFETEVLNEIAREASSSLSVPAIAAATIELAGRLLPIDSGSLLLLTDDSLDVAFSTHEGRRIDGDSPFGIDAGLLARLRRDHVAIVDGPGGVSLGSDGPALHSTAYCALGIGDEPEGVLVLSTSLDGGYSDAHRRVLEGIGAHLGLAVKNARLFESVKQLHLGNLRALSSALLAKDYYTIGHTARVAAYAVLLAQELGWSRPAVEEVEEVAFLHDIGKIAVSDRVLLKPTPLNDEEWYLMRQHPLVSAQIIEPLMDPRLVDGVRHHHERYDGQGYPHGLAGEAIPELARLMAVVDAYDAMSSRRVYRHSLSRAECLAELVRCRGAQFDPQMVDAFMNVLRDIEAKKVLAAAAAAAAADRVDPRKHALLRTPADATRPEYAEILADLRAVKATHPPVACVSTQVTVDDQRVMMVVDSDDDPQTHAEIGQLLFADEEEMEMLRGREWPTDNVYVDAWGVWVTGVAPVRDETGTVVAIVSADIPAADSPGLITARSDVNETFTDLARDAADRVTRAEIDAMTDPLTGLYNHQHLQRRLAQECGGAGGRESELSLLLCDIDHFRRLNDRLGHSSGDNALKSIAAIVSGCIRRLDLAARYGGDQFAVMMLGVGAEEAQEIAERIRAGIQSAQVSQRWDGLTVSIGVATLTTGAETREGLIAKADQALALAKRGGGNRCVPFSPGIAQASRELPVEPADLRYLGAMAELADAKTRYEGRHSEAVKRLAVALAWELGLPPDEASHVGEAAKLRDIGLIAVPDAILGKPSALTESDWLMVHEHCLTGQSLLRGSGAADAIAEAILSHHERYDGSGYPDGLKGERIPLTARIVAVASAYQAMVVSRPYRETLSQEDALAEMGRCAGSQFDPDVVACLQRVTAADATFAEVPREAAPRTGPPGRV